MSKGISFYKYDDSIDLLEMSTRTIHALQRGNIHTVGALVQAKEANIIGSIQNIGEVALDEIKECLDAIQILTTKIEINNESKIDDLLSIEDVVYWQVNAVNQQLLQLRLHENVTVFDSFLKDWLNTSKNDTKAIYQVLIAILTSQGNISQEIEYLLEPLSERDIFILTRRYALDPATLEEVGDELDITRERVRQISKKIERDILGSITGIRVLRIQTILCVIQDFGMDISYEEWLRIIVNAGLIGNWSDESDFSDYDPIQLLLPILIISEKDFSYLKIPDVLKYCVELKDEGKPDVPANQIHLMEITSKATKKTIQRHTKFSGAVSAKWLANNLRMSVSNVETLLNALGYFEIENLWYMPPNRDAVNLDKNDAFHNNLRKMFQFCGPLDLEDIVSALWNALSRTDFPVPPTHILSEVLKMYGYTNEEGLWYWAGNIDEELSGGEMVILNCIQEYGPVVHHSTLAEAFIESSLSFPSLHGTLSRSPLFDKVEKALYKLRGANIDWQDTEQAKQNVGRTPVDLSLRYTVEGNLIVEANLGILAIGTGTLSSETLPNLTGEPWHCHYQGSKLRDVEASDGELRYLNELFSELGCETGDRVQLEFNMWERSVTGKLVEM